MSGVLAWAAEALIASAVLIAAVLVARAPVRRAFGAQVAYLLWTLPALRLVLPPLPDLWTAAAPAPVTRANRVIEVLVTSQGGAVPAEAAVSLGAVLAGLWVGGAMLFLGVQLVRHRRFCRAVLADAVPIQRFGAVRVIASAAAPGPVAFGVGRRFVALPDDFAQRYDTHEQALAIAHEIGHHRRGDLLANWIGLVVLAVHWFNPLAWRAWRAFRADQELANDAHVLAGRDAAERHAYACAIVKAAHGRALPAACHLHSVLDLKGRLRMIATSPASRRRLATGTALVTLLAASGLAMTASGSRATAAVAARAVRSVGIVQPTIAAPAAIARPAQVAAPQTAPVAPVPPAPPVPPTPKPGADISVNTNVSKLGAATNVSVNVTSADCGPDDGKRQFVVDRQDGDRRVTVICTDRITKAAMAGQMTEADGEDIERKALTAALDGLRQSRTGIAGNAAMDASARSEALAGIDEAIKEIEGDLANVGKD